MGGEGERARKKRQGDRQGGLGVRHGPARAAVAVAGRRQREQGRVRPPNSPACPLVSFFSPSRPPPTPPLPSPAARAEK